MSCFINNVNISCKLQSKRQTNLQIKEDYIFQTRMMLRN